MPKEEPLKVDFTDFQYWRSAIVCEEDLDEILADYEWTQSKNLWTESLKRAISLVSWPGKTNS